MDSLGRIVRRVQAGAGGTSDLFQSGRALGAGVAHIFLTSDVNHLAYESAFRPLATHPGWRNIAATSPASVSWSEAPRVNEIDWRSPELVAGCANACLGTHLVHRDASQPSLWPWLYLRARAEGPGSGGTDTLGIYLGITRGIGTPPTPDDPYVSTRVQATASWVDVNLALELREDFLGWVAEPVVRGDGGSGVVTLGEPLRGFVFTAWVGCYSNAGKGSLVALSLALEPLSL